MDKIDYNILNSLLTNKKFDYKKTAKELQMPLSSLYYRISKLEKEGVLLGFQPKINVEKLGYDVFVAIDIVVNAQMDDEIAKYAEDKNVCSIYDVSGNYDYLVLARFKSIKEFDSFIKKLMKEPFIKKTTTSIILNNKKEKASPFPLE